MRILNILMLFLLLSCNNKKEQENDNEYKSTINTFQSSLINHFPQNALDKKGDILIKDLFHYHNSLSLILVRDLDVNNAIQLSKKLDNKKIDSTSLCLVMVNDFLNKNNIGDPFLGAKSKYNAHCTNYKVIPNFFETDFYNSNSSTNIDKDFNIYLLDMQTGIYSKKIKIEESSMPKSIMHGFSKGLAISVKKKKIIYWVIVW